MSSGRTARLRGKLSFYTSLTCGKVGRGAMQPLIEHQYGRGKRTLDFDVMNCLRWWLKAIEILPCRKISLYSPEKVVIYSDANGDGQLGVYSTNGKTAEYTSCVAPEWVRRYGIFALEMCAALLALITLSREKREKSVFFNIDNQSALAALVKGRTNKKPVDRICEIFWLLMAGAGRATTHSIWLEYVKSAVNIADYPSRMDISKCGESDDPFVQFCKERKIPIPSFRETPKEFWEILESEDKLEESHTIDNVTFGQ